MRFTSKIFYITILFLIMVSCEDFSTDLEVENLNDPNDEILASDPTALKATAGTIIHNWYMTTHSGGPSPGASLATMADISTCSWASAGMRDLSSEPRVAFNNSSSYDYQNITRRYFNAFYAILTDANAIALAIESGTEFEDPAQMEMIARLGQALSVGYLALIFDKVWLSDENGVIGDDAVDYKEAMTFALEKLDQAILIAQVNNVSIPDAWLPGGAGNSATFLQFMNSMGARMLVNNVRNSSQKAQIDWNRVLNYTNNGLAIDFEIYMDDVIWYDDTSFFLHYPGWGRVDMRIIHLMDPDTPDYWEDSFIDLPPSSSPDARLLSDYQYLSYNDFVPERGIYHFSSYRYSRMDEYITIWQMNIVEFSRSENDMYKAEAMALLGNVAGAAAVINAGTRTIRGQLPNVAADLDEVKSAIFYERMVEFSFTAMGIGFFEMRKEDLLQKGTLLHFPIPGSSLEVIPAPNYTYGGTDGVAGEDYSNGGWR